MAVHSGDRLHWNKILLITALAERHYGNYALYSEITERPELAKQWRKILNKAWEYLSGQLTSMKNLEKALLALEEITPEPQDEDGYGVYPALDACLLLTSALQMILDDSIDDCETACGLSLHTVIQFIAFSNDLDADAPDIQQHPLYQQEVELQTYLQDTLDSTREKEELVKSLRKEFNTLDSSNLGIPLDA